MSNETQPTKKMFGKKPVNTVDAAIEPMKKTLANLGEVVAVRNAGAKAKAEQIKNLEAGRAEDVSESEKATRILEKLNELFS